MPDTLTQEERAAIANYRGPVQIIPRGRSAFEYGVVDVNVWNTKESFALSKKQRERRSRERKEFRDLCESGKSVQHIADLLGILTASVIKRARKMKVEIKSLGKYGLGQFHREDICMQMHQEGRSMKEISEATGMTPSGVQRMVKRLGLR